MRKVILFWVAMLPMVAISQPSSVLTLPGLPVSLMDDWDEAKKSRAPAKQPEEENVPKRVPTESSESTVSIPVVNINSKLKAPTNDTNISANEITLVPGVVDVQPIAIGHLNRFEMPFDNPQIRTISDADFQVIGRVIYINSDNPGVISLYITNPDEDVALSLALTPQRIPPRDVKIRIGQKMPGGTVSVGHENPLAKKTETASDYVASVRSILSDVAQGKIPRGYGWQQIKNPNMKDIHHCFLDGLSITPMQRLDGHRYLITVSKVTNLSPSVIEIDERLCYRQGIVAVSAWPEVVLQPGQETELYMVHQRSVFKPVYDGNRRPSVLDNNGGQ